MENDCELSDDELEGARARLMVLRVLLRAKEDWREIGELIEGSPTPEAARDAVADRWGMVAWMAQAVIDVPFRNLSRSFVEGVEREIEYLERALGEQ